MRDENNWNAVTEKDPKYDGKFFYGVKSTKIFCKPSCPSRTPLKKNIVYFLTANNAKEAGYKICKRCMSGENSKNKNGMLKLLNVCRMIEQHDQGALTATQLAKTVDLTQYQLHRLFKKYLDVTPKSYIDQMKLISLKQNLRHSENVTNAIYNSGFESSSVIYGRMKSHLGMTPKKYREGGDGESISYGIGQTELGRVLIAATDKGLCFLQFGESDHLLLAQLISEYPRAEIEPMTYTGQEHLSNWLSLLNKYASGISTNLDIPIDVRGTAFQKKVWDFLRQIPYGDVMSYGEIAEAIGAPKAFRAVANACSGNNIALVIPCHRVIRGDGGLGGYRWGESRKRTIIDMERRVSSQQKE